MTARLFQPASETHLMILGLKADEPHLAHEFHVTGSSPISQMSRRALPEPFSVCPVSSAPLSGYPTIWGGTLGLVCHLRVRICPKRANTVVGATTQVPSHVNELAQERLSIQWRGPVTIHFSTHPLKLKPESEDRQQIITPAFIIPGTNGCFSSDPCDSLKNCSWRY